MAFIEIKNVTLKGVSGCVPIESYPVKNFDLFTADEAARFSESTGVYNLRIASKNTTTADLTCHAAKKLLEELNWNSNEIDVLILVTQTPDFLLPATSCILQDRLGIKEDALVLDISLGCSGWVYGLLTLSNFMTSGNLKKGLLLVGDTISKLCSPEDKSTFPLFGDGGSATALEYCKDAAPLKFHWGVDGKGANAIIVPEGGFRNPFTKNSFEVKTFEKGISRSPLNLVLEGMDVFSFGISKAPQSVNKLLDHFQIDREKLDFFVFHQANLFMNEKIRKKLKVPEEKVPYSLKNFGNTSSASIPITMCTEMKESLKTSRSKIIACGFGVGLSWGSVYFETENIVCPELVEI